MSSKTLADTLLNYYQENEDDFNHDIEEMDNWNGFLGFSRIEPMEELNVICHGEEAIEILRSAFFGHDENSVQSATFNPNRDYFYYDGYGNLVSTDFIDYSDYLDDDCVQKIIDNKSHLCLSDGAQEIIDNYEDFSSESIGELSEQEYLYYGIPFSCR